ncbi:MAG: aminomethyl-transferring glycine dehydrogenase [Saprospiraceae bacterium]|nr:aminomethyl-transferring glycine dehydrogenase [Saprospiraceae bacterium]
MATFAQKSFQRRHIGISEEEKLEMLSMIGIKSVDELIDLTIPDHIKSTNEMDIPDAISEYQYLKDLKVIAEKNKIFKNYIGQGYYGTITPSVILRNVFHNPGWYTQYTPYQAEIAQGRLEALLNFQTMVSDLTGLPIANASLLDEGTAAAEAMAMFEGARNKKRKKNPATKFFIDDKVFEQTVDIMITRAKPIGIEIVRGAYSSFEMTDDFIGALIQYPNSEGSVEDYQSFANSCSELGAYVCVAADLLSLTLLSAPGEWGAHAVVGNTQRFGVPMGYGGPHAAYFSTIEDFKRQIPGRIIGVSQDRLENPSLRMALQTREQHIKRERATSNICTAQALLAVMASMYAVYHGPEGIKDIASTIHHHTYVLFNNLKTLGFEVVNSTFFDTLTIKVTDEESEKIRIAAESNQINLFYKKGAICISVDETTDASDIKELLSIFAAIIGSDFTMSSSNGQVVIPSNLQRTTDYLTHPVFSMHHTESKMMRYIKSLENKDLSLVHSMIALGSCTMKLNAATELIPVSWPEFSLLHPFAPSSQTEGYAQIFDELSKYLCEATGFTACSLQPNSGAQGEYTGLMTIAAYHEDRGDIHRNIALIPSSAHGTNPASAVMAGMKVVVVKCDDDGNIDVDDLVAKAELHKDNLASLMITYPSTHGVFETKVKEICETIHTNGGLVYMDGANMNAQVGLTSPGIIGADVCHLNLHKTFAIPHGGGGPGMGPICVNDKLAPYLPSHTLVKTGGEKGITAVSAAPWGSASILLISYAYIRMLGREGMTNATKYAILNANYMRVRLEDHYPVLYKGEKGMAAHEMILDLRQFKPLKITAEDIAKRLIDYGFHAPTLSFPVAGTIMIEPTESEDKAELDRFCDALIHIKAEIDAIADGSADSEDNVLRNAPHTLHEITADAWNHPYSRSEAAYPLPYLYTSKKFWATTTRVDNAYGDRNLVCTCPPIEMYEE